MRPPMPLHEFLLRVRAMAGPAAARARACARARARAMLAEAEAASGAVASCAEARARAAHAYLLRAQRQAGASVAGRRLRQATDSAASTLMRVAYGQSPPTRPSYREMIKKIEQHLLDIYSVTSMVDRINFLNNMFDSLGPYGLSYILALLAPAALYCRTLIVDPVAAFYEAISPTAPETICAFLDICSIEDEIPVEEALGSVFSLCIQVGGLVVLCAGGVVLSLCMDIGLLVLGMPGQEQYHVITGECSGDMWTNSGSSPLMCAIYGNAPEPVVKLLLDRGANPNIASKEGYTVLHFVATKQDRLEIADILLSREAHVDSMSVWGTPLHLAELLLKYKANPNRVVQIFYAPLTSLNCVELLIKAGADVNAGRPVTPLVVAARDGLTDCIKCLLEAHADPNVPNKLGRMPVAIAAIHGRKECVEILFPVTSPVARFADWSVDGIMQHVKSGSSEGHFHKSEEPALKALGNAAFVIKDYAHASALYTKAMETDPKDSTLYAKRCLCWLHMGEREKALDDANTCKRMGLDVSNCCPKQVAALILAEDYGQACDALISSLKLDSGSGLAGEVSREEDK